MPYTIPVPYVANTPISSGDIRSNNVALRKYINKNIIASDIAAGSVDTTEIVAGEPNFITGDYQFTTGNQYNQVTDGEDINYSYFTGQIKTIDASTYDMWWTVAETGKEVELEEPARILIHAGIEISSDKNYAMDYDDDGSVDNDGLGTEILLNIDGTLYQVTSGFSFEETSGIVGPSQTSVAKCKRRWYPVSYLTTTLSAGMHKIYFQVNPVVDKGSVRARNVTFEVFYI